VNAPELPRKYGQVAFEAYRAKVIETGEAREDQAPQWFELGERQRMAWDAAFDASVEYAARVPS